MGLETGYLYDNANVVWYGTETYNQALNALKTVTGKSDYAVEAMLNGQYGAADYWAAVQALEDNGVIIAKNSNGYNCFAYASDVTMTAPSGPMYQIDSGATSTTLVKGAPAYDVVVDNVSASPTYGKVVTNPMGSVLTPEHGFYGWKFFAGECLQAVSAVGMGITLGKTIDSALYNLNPDFWDSVGMASLNPETWGTITNGDDSFAAGLFNTIFGIDPNTGKGQMFISDEAAAYLAYYMSQNGFFANSGVEPTRSTYQVGDEIESTSFMYGTVKQLCDLLGFIFIDWTAYYPSRNQNLPAIVGTVNDDYVVAFSDVSSKQTIPSATSFEVTNVQSGDVPRYTIDGNLGYVTAYYKRSSTTSWTGVGSNYRSVFTTLLNQSTMYPISVRAVQAMEGVSNQEGATLPDDSTWTDIPSTLTSLQNQYPELWDNAVPNTIVQPDGSTKTLTYIPIAMPNANGQWDSQPTSDTDNSSQASPEVEPQPSPTPSNNDLLRLLLQLVTMPETNPDTQTQTQTQTQPDIPDMPDTGEGSSPVPVAPSGSSSALWAVYHPTQGEINSFGAWLWSSNFVDQLLKVFQNPMDAIITLHKVFVTPVDAGTTTIHAGYLDSNVSSSYVTQQYVYVNCGSVDCKEYFGTVFDYLGTSVSLYLPFIGIVPLNVDEVMRSTINVNYGCDLFTGAILAEVTVTRDGNDIIMYQYGGDGSVQYPVSGSRSGGFLTGLAATIGAAASVATGGALLPAAATALGGSVMSAQKQVQHSGGFSGNSGAMGCKTPYLIIERPQTKTAGTFPRIDGYPTNYSSRLGDLEGQVNVKSVHVEGIDATDAELKEIESLLKSGVLV